MVVINKDFSQMSKIQKWRHFLRRRYQQLENNYYNIVDDLCQKIEDLQEIKPANIPNLEIKQFKFIKDWENGLITSYDVLKILNEMDLDKVAEIQLTRRLDKYIENNKIENLKDYLIMSRSLIRNSCLDSYRGYLNMLKKYFLELCKTDKNQEKITWIEQLKENKKNNFQIKDLSINQTVNYIKNSVIPFNEIKVYIGNNIICMDEEIRKGVYINHWLFGPKNYIDFLKKEFKVTESMPLDQESDYIKNVIGNYVS